MKFHTLKFINMSKKLSSELILKMKILRQRGWSIPEIEKELFIHGLTNLLGIPLSRIKIEIRLYEDLNLKKCISFWSSISGVSHKEIKSVNIINGKKKGKLEYGMCRIRVSKGYNLLKYITAVREEAYRIICPRSSTDRTGAS